MTTNIWYLDNAGDFQLTDNSTMIKVEDMLQRLQTFKGEQSFNAANGIDYLGVFNRQSFLKPQIDTIINDYTQYFASINYTVLPEVNNNVEIDMNILLFNGSTVLKSFVV